MSYIKVYKYKKQISLDNGVTWQDVTPVEYVPSGDPIGYYDTYEECMAQYRTIQSGTTCVGVDKHNQDVYEVSYDNGVTWEVVSTSAGTLIEANSPDCGYTPGFNGKYKLTLSDSSIVTGACGGENMVTYDETSAYTNSIISVEIGDCVRTIYEAFKNCTGLTSCTIGSGVTSIGGEAFYNCTNLSSIDIPNSVTGIGDRTFESCYNLTSCTIGNSVTRIGDRAFGWCESLTNITIPNSVTSIYQQAFAGCTGLTSVTIGNSVTSIGDEAFGGCSSLASITVLAVTPPTLEYDVFGYTNDCPIYVPSSSVNTYKAASGWSTYSSRIQAIP